METDSDRTPTDAQVAAAEQVLAARQGLVEQLEELKRRQDRLRQDAFIEFTVAVDMECAGGLRRKTHYGYEVSARPPRQALQAVDKALAAWRAAHSQLDAEFEALYREFNSIKAEYLAALKTMDRWLDAAKRRQQARSRNPT